jgi:hypothetical protein
MGTITDYLGGLATSDDAGKGPETAPALTVRPSSPHERSFRGIRKVELRNREHDLETRDKAPSAWRWALIGGFLIAAFFLLGEHRAHFLGVLPWVLLLACPFLHLFMHGGHRGSGNPHAGRRFGITDGPAEERSRERMHERVWP